VRDSYPQCLSVEATNRATGAPRNIFLGKCVLAWLVLSDSSLVMVKDFALRCLDLHTQKILLVGA
jgi:hypothetical protein